MTETEESKLSESIAQGDRRPSHGRGNLRVLQGPDRPLQGATLCKIRRFLPHDRDWQNSEVRDA